MRSAPGLFLWSYSIFVLYSSPLSYHLRMLVSLNLVLLVIFSLMRLFDGLNIFIPCLLWSACLWESHWAFLRTSLQSVSERTAHRCTGVPVAVWISMNSSSAVLGALMWVTWIDKRRRRRRRKENHPCQSNLRTLWRVWDFQLLHSHAPVGFTKCFLSPTCLYLTQSWFGMVTFRFPIGLRAVATAFKNFDFFYFDDGSRSANRYEPIRAKIIITACISSCFMSHLYWIV